MNPSAFLALQDLDTALDVITHQRPRLPEVIAHQQAAAAVAELEAGLAEAQQRIDAAQAAIEASEHAAGELTKKRSRLEAQLKTVIAPREAEALMHEIDTINAHRSDLDDQELAALDEQAQGEAAAAALTAELPAREASLTAAQAQLAAAHATVDAEVASLREQREAVVAGSRESTALYERGAQSCSVGWGREVGGFALQRLPHGSVCPSSIVKAVPADTLAECPQCGRIIVR
jgi:hypothetical protein